MLRSSLALELFKAAYMKRWNDKLCPIELIELDKQAHKMMIAFFLGKFEENAEGFRWLDVIEGGIFELLQRIVVTDLKPPVFYKLKNDPETYKKLNDWVFKKIKPFIPPNGNDFETKFKEYFNSTDDTINKRVLSAAHFYATKWEFNIIKYARPNDYEIPRIENELMNLQEKYYDLEGIKQLALYEKYNKFIDLCGQLRFQSRWSHMHRIPKTSVSGHMLFVAILSYFFSISIDACEKRTINNYFTGLFHDLPEVLTRDIISPVKRSFEGLEGIIKTYEKEEMEKEVYPLILPEWEDELRMFTGMMKEFPSEENEFYSIVKDDSGKIIKTESEEINVKFNEDKYNPRDGEIVKIADDLAVFIEALAATKNGCVGEEFFKTMSSYKERYMNAGSIAGIDIGALYAEF